MPGLKITLLQQPLIWMDGPANLRHFDRQLETVAGRDVIVLPEMFTSGFAMEAANKSLPQEEVVSWMRSKAQQTNALIAGSVAIQSERGPVNRFCWLNPKVMCISTTSAICSAWRMSTSITGRVTRALLLNGAAGAFCRWSVTTCVFRYGRAIATITTLRCMLPIGLRRVRYTGRFCSPHERLRTGLM